MLISSKEKLTTTLYPQQIRNQIRRELIEQQILEAQEFAMVEFICGDLDGMIYFYKKQVIWQQILSDYNKIVGK